MSNEYEATIRDMQKSIQEYEKQVNTWMKTAEKFSSEASYVRFERDIYLSILREIEKTINDAGLVPKYHHHVMKKHRSEWPALWEIIDKGIKKIND